MTSPVAVGSKKNLKKIDMGASWVCAGVKKTKKLNSCQQTAR
tara:strand:- start:364 stop:489 length:126 start_codon:yes stop_codon:yes gene_type:complete